MPMPLPAHPGVSARLLSPYFQFWSKPVSGSFVFGNFNTYRYREREKEQFQLLHTMFESR